MDGIVNLPLFIISSIIIIMAPGPDFVYVTTRGFAEGNKAGILSALGISSGLMIHTMFAAFGLSAVIQSSLVAYTVIKFAGAGYLIFIGVKAILQKVELEELQINPNKKKSVFGQAVITNVFNPKAVITFVAFLPQFINIKMGNHVLQFLFLGILLSFIAAVWFGIVGYSAGFFGTFVKRNRTIKNAIKYLSGTIMIALGIRVALIKD